MNYYNVSSERYSRAADIATRSGLRRGSGEWWQRIREELRKQALEREVGS